MLFDSSLRNDLSRGFGATLVVLMTIVLTMALIRMLGLAALGRISPQDVVLLLGYTTLGQLPTMLSLSMFIAVVASLSRMYRDSEMSIWFASGVGLGRFVRPVLRTAAPVLMVVVLLSLFVYPWVNQRSAELRERFERRSDLSRITPGQFQTSSDGQRVFFIERDNQDSATGRNVFIVSQQPGHESVTSARTGRIQVEANTRYLQLDNGQRHEMDLASGDKTLSRFETYQLVVGDRIDDSATARPPKALSTLELLRAPTAAYQGELTWRLGMVLGGTNLVLLGIGLAATHPRRANSWNLLLALLGFVVYYNLINLSQAWVATSKLTMGMALLLTHGGMLALALALLWWRDHRNTWQSPWKQRRQRLLAIGAAS